MHLTPRSRSILIACQLKADQSIEELAATTRIPPHTVRRELSSLRERGLIIRLPFVDVFRLGYMESQFFFTVASERSEGSAASFVGSLRNSWRVPWLATLGGTYHYGATIIGRDVSETVDFLESLSRLHPLMLQNKALNTLISFRYLLKRHLVEDHDSIPLDWVGVSMCESLGEHDNSVSYSRFEADSLDRRILAELFRSSERSNKDLATAVGITRSTFEYRLSRLIDEQIIIRFINVIPPGRLGMLTYKLIVSLRVFDSAIWEELCRFCQDVPNIVNIIHCVGKWDYELGVEVTIPNQAFQIAQKLSLFLGERLAAIEIIPVFQQIVPTNFLGLE